MQKVIEKSEGLISFNENMLTNFQELPIEKENDKEKKFPYKIIPQSVIYNKNKNTKEKEEELNIIFNRLDIDNQTQKKIILFPAGIRTIKDPLFITNEIINFLQKKENSDFICLLIGSIYDKNLYEKISNLTKNFKKNFKILSSIEHKDFILLLENSKICLNSSINEGMSNVILEALSIGVPVLARKNEGNCKLIINDYNGMLFDTPEEFTQKLNFILKDDFNNDDDVNNDNRNNFIKKIIENGKLIIKENFSYEVEKNSYKDFLGEIFCRYYFDYEGFSFFFSKNTHPFSFENNEIFDVKKILIYFLFIFF